MVIAVLRDITLGQFVPGQSFIHKLDARFKTVLIIAFTVLVFVSKNFASIGLVAVLLVGASAASRIPAKMLIRSFKPLLPFILFTVILNMFYVDGQILWQFWVLKITKEGLLLSAMMALRIIFMLLGGSLLTFTTSPIVLTDALERLMKPLSWIKVPVHDIAMMMTIALRFIPTLIDETEKIMNAQKARGADLESGGPLKRAKALIPILVPLFVSAFKRADELALAMECRCYTGGKGRTRLKQMKAAPRDGFAVLITAAVTTGVIWLNAILPPIITR